MTSDPGAPLPSRDGRGGARGSDDDARANNFGVLRLCLASLVILGHAPEIIDGNANRDLLNRVAGGGTLGGLAVTGFFLLSGYLIAMSMLRTGRVREYLVKRVLRIVPGFAVAYLLSVFVLAPVLGAPVGAAFWPALKNLVLLQEPPTFFTPEPHFKTINGALWSISFEFRCYLLIAALWLLGVLPRRRWVATLTAGVGAIALTMGLPALGIGVGVLDRLPVRSVAFTFIFLTGTCVYLFRAELLPRLNGVVALLASIAALALLGVPNFGSVLYLIPLAAALFWLALKADLGRVQRINERWDISYGVYLYGWPCAMIVLILWPGVPASALAAATLVLAVIAGTASWLLVERWFKLRGGALFGRRLHWLVPADQAAI